MQVAFVSGNTYTFVQLFAAGLFLYTGSSAVIGYYPSNAMVRPCVCLCVCAISTFLVWQMPRVVILCFADWLFCFAPIVHVWQSTDHLCFHQRLSFKDSGKIGKDWGLVAGCRSSHWFQVMFYCMLRMPLLHASSDFMLGLSSWPICVACGCNEPAETKVFIYIGSFFIVLTLLMVNKQHQKWSWVLADFEVSLL